MKMRIDFYKIFIFYWVIQAYFYFDKGTVEINGLWYEFDEFEMREALSLLLNL